MRRERSGGVCAGERRRQQRQGGEYGGLGRAGLGRIRGKSVPAEPVEGTESIQNGGGSAGR